MASCPIWPSRPLGNLIWAVLGCAWGAPGGSWAALGASRGAPGASWGAPGASWDAPGVHFGLPGVTFWSLLDLFSVSPCEMAKTLKFVDSMALFEVFPGPEGSRIARKSTPGASWAALGGPAGVHGAQVEVHGVQVGLHRAQVALHRPSWSPCRGTQGRRNSAQLAQPKSGQVQNLSKHQYID